MAWNPDIYNQFKSERFTPFYDLLALVNVKPAMKVIDLGCGTGELTAKLAAALPESSVTGIDSSGEMLLDASAFTSEHVRFELKNIEDQLNLDEKWDLVFSNAAIQWVNDHELLLPKIISRINPGGQLAIQIPSQHHNITNTLLEEIANEAPFRDILKNWKRGSPVLETEAYAQILFENGGKDITVFEKIYPLILKDTDALFNWVSGTALIPYLERLPEEIRPAFIGSYKKALHRNFTECPVFYPFKRIIMAAAF